MFATISYPPIPIWDLGPINFSMHGVFAALGFLLGSMLILREVRKRGYDTLKYQSVLTWGLVGALIGARYFTAPAQLFDGVPFLDAMHPLQGNFSIMGGFAGGVIAGGWRMKMLDLPVLAMLDLATFGLALGTAVGRIGDLIIVEHLGQATDVAWGYGVKPGYELAPQHSGLQCPPMPVGTDGFCGIYHHVAIYDMIGAAILLGVIYFVYRRYKLHYGQLFFLWMAWYGMQRFLLDGLRFGMGDAVIGGFTWNQLSGLAASLAGLILFWLMRSRQPIVSPEEDEKRGAVLVVEPAAR